VVISRRNAFREAWDWFHFLLGFLSALLLAFPFGWFSSLVLTVVFIVYEALQAESPIDSYMDIIEYLAGAYVGVVCCKALNGLLLFCLVVV